MHLPYFGQDLDSKKMVVWILAHVCMWLVGYDQAALSTLRHPGGDGFIRAMSISPRAMVLSRCLRGCHMHQAKSLW